MKLGEKIRCNKNRSDAHQSDCWTSHNKWRRTGEGWVVMLHTFSRKVDLKRPLEVWNNFLHFNIWPLRNFFYIMPLRKIFLSNPAYDPNHLELLLSFGWRKDVGAIFRLSLHKRSTCTAYQLVNRNDYYIIYINLLFYWSTVVVPPQQKFLAPPRPCIARKSLICTFQCPYFSPFKEENKFYMISRH